MPIAKRTLETLEFPNIRTRLANYTSFSASRELALTLMPSSDTEEVTQRLRLTSEARRLLDAYPQATIGGARDVRAAAQHAARGGILEPGTLLEVANTLRSIRQLRALLLKLDADVYRLLSELAADLPHLPALEEQIDRTLDIDGTVLDSASSKLGHLRRNIRTLDARLQERLHNLVTSSKYTGVLQESIVTVRDGRYVVPVKAAQRRSLPGLVHDQSASGATLYIEPMPVVELNNDLRETRLAEQQEVKRILAELSDRVGTAADELIAGVETLALIDLAFAQAKYAFALRCIAPHVQTSDDTTATDGAAPPLLLTAARHPLLNQETVVPVDVWLGSDFQLLLITGPNTGGKTVALKTVGLLALMAQSGLHIPADEPSRLPVFTQIFADIGDEQSIEQSLSTFSSHMTTIIDILRAIDRPEQPGATLVLLDELGAGTDPVEGAALARAICGRLLERHCMAVCTTHYAELKVFAHNTPNVQNASVEFDLDTLAPTYRLMIGIPGRSNALAIAERLGLDAALVEAARSTLDREELQLEGLLATIHQEREAAAAKLQSAEQIRSDAEKYRERYKEALRELQETLQDRVDEASRELEGELRRIREETRRLREEPRSATLARQWAQEAEQRIQELQAQAQATGQRILGPVTERQQAGAAAVEEAPPRPLQVGDRVLVRSLRLEGDILSIDEDDTTAEVQVGGFRVEVGLEELRREKAGAASANHPARPGPPRSPPPLERTLSLPEQPEVPLSYDMRGWRAADVSERLDRYLNDAYLAGMPSVRLIHGKGSGVLRQVVRDILSQHPLVTSFAGGGSEGGEGVTIATLTER